MRRLSLPRIEIPDSGPAGVGKQLAKEVGEDDLGNLAAALAYRFFLALFPFVIFLAALSGFITQLFNIQNPTDRIINTIGDTLPSDVTSIIRTQLESVISSRNLALLSAGAAGTVWASATGVMATTRILNRAYGVRETRPIWERYLLAIGMTVFAGFLIIASFLLLVISQAAGTKIAGKIGLGGATADLVPLASWPISIVMILLAVGVLYRVGPNAKLSVKRILPGTVMFTGVWLIATYLFGLYIAHFASYNSTYGTLGGVVILLVWFYLTAFILILGGELNAVLDDRAKVSP
ncbi:MAG: YihY/virulence factor BrkB family protein [Dehalococcoidia bacterium]